jgi:hypothetical protein
MTESREAGIERRRKDAAKRALAEAEERSKRQAGRPLAKESGNRQGPEPTRYGDWERNGIASDF